MRTGWTSTPFSTERGARCHPQAEGRRWHRHRRISAEQGGALMRVLEAGEAASYVAEKLVSRGSAIEPKVERTVAQIIRDVRAQGDEALRKYARELDGLGEKNPCWSAARNWKPPGARFRRSSRSHRASRAQHPPLCRVADAKIVGADHGAGHPRGTAGGGDRIGWLLRSRRALSAALVGAHDGDSRAGCGSQSAFRWLLLVRRPRLWRRPPCSASSVSIASAARRRWLPLPMAPFRAASRQNRRPGQ